MCLDCGWKPEYTETTSSLDTVKAGLAFLLSFQTISSLRVHTGGVGCTLSDSCPQTTCMCPQLCYVYYNSTTDLLKQLQAVCVIIISKVDDSRLAVVGVERLPQPPQGQIPLHSPSWNSGIPSVTSQLIVPGCLYIEVGVV